MSLPTKTRDSLVKAVNKMFPEHDKGYPIAFDVDDEVRITGESWCSYKGEGPMSVVDYYEAPRDWDFGVHPALSAYLEKRGFYVEWANPAYVVVYEI